MAKTIVPCVAVLLVLAVFCGAATEHKSLRRAVQPGGEILVAHHKRWDKACRPLPLPAVKITRPPAHGTAAVREGTYVIDETWHPDAHTSCRGTSVPGRGVYYRADPSYKGVDTFEYEVTLGVKRPTTYGVDVQINVN
ncbi:MAG: hypothetical protein AB9873_09870 [Syntrophobacteraceae bacterium]